MSTEISSLAGEIVAFTYPSLIKVADNGDAAVVTSSNRASTVVTTNPNKTQTPNAFNRLSDGNGNPLSISVAQTDGGAKIFGPTIIAGSSNCVQGKVLEVQDGGVCIENQICACGSGSNHLCGATNTDDLNVADALVVSNLIHQTSTSGNTSLSGDLFVGTTSGPEFSVDSATGCTTIKGFANIGDDCASSDVTLTNKGILLNKGVIRGCADIIAFYSSDERLKDNVKKITNSNNIINSLNGYKFDWKEKADRVGSDIGVIAQEVKEVLPDIVHEREDGYLAVDYVKLIPVLIEEVKSLNNRIKVLEENYG
jgi:hypothetical protein